MKSVARGAALLDEKVPGWENLVDVDRLDMGHCEDCVLGQIAKRKGWVEGVNPFDSAILVLGLGWVDSKDHGFVWFPGRVDAWKAAIRRRRRRARVAA